MVCPLRLTNVIGKLSLSTPIQCRPRSTLAVQCFVFVEVRTKDENVIREIFCFQKNDGIEYNEIRLENKVL
ncbi:hypothetical protein HN51_041542 [Arachis hypogaea]